MRFAMAASMTITLVVFAGCIGPSEGDEVSPDSHTNTPIEPEIPNATTNDTAPPATRLPSNLTELNWEITGSHDIAYHFVLAPLSSERGCRFSSQHSVNSPLNPVDPQGMVVQAVFNDLHLHSAGFGVSQGGTRAGTDSSNAGSASGNLFEGSRLDAYVMLDGKSGTATWTFSLDVTCDQPFDVVVSETAPLYGLFDYMEMDSTASVANGFGPSTSIEANMDVEASADATAWFSSPGSGQGTWTITDGSETWTTSWEDPLGFPELHTLSGGTGSWTFTLNHVQWWVGSPWAGLHGPWESAPDVLATPT